MFNNITTQRRAKRRANDNPQTINSLCHTAFFRRVTFSNNCLRSNQQCTTTNTL